MGLWAFERDGSHPKSAMFELDQVFMSPEKLMTKDWEVSSTYHGS